MVVTTNSTEETKKLAKQLVNFISPSDVIALYGDLGAGKTTLTKFIAEEIGSTARVQSPTFVIARTYQVERNEKGIKKIHHIDLYRITTPEAALDSGITDLMGDSDSVCIIEWPEVVKDFLPKDVITVKMVTTGENQREISFDKI